MDWLPLGPEEGQGGDRTDLPSRNDVGDLNGWLALTQPQRTTGPIGLALQTEINAPNPRRQS
jgi:hypothetical protein